MTAGIRGLVFLLSGLLLQVSPPTPPSDCPEAALSIHMGNQHGAAPWRHLPATEEAEGELRPDVREVGTHSPSPTALAVAPFELDSRGLRCNGPSSVQGLLTTHGRLRL